MPVEWETGKDLLRRERNQHQELLPVEAAVHSRSERKTQLPVGQGSEVGALVRINLEKLPVTRASMQDGVTGEAYGRQGIIVRHCWV